MAGNQWPGELPFMAQAGRWVRRGLGRGLRFAKAAAGFGQRLVEAGTAPYRGDTKRRLMILNFIAYIIIVSTAIYSVQHLFVEYARYEPLILLNAGIIVGAAAVPFLHRVHELAGGLWLLGLEYVGLIAIMAIIGRDSGVHLQYFVAAAACFVVFGLERLRLVVSAILVGTVLHLASWFAFPGSAALIQAGPEVLNSIYSQAAITTMALIGASVWYAFSLAEQARAETDALMLRVLPGAIAERLKAAPDRAIAEAHPEASVLFADVAGFVALAHRLGPDRTVTLLNELIRDLDQAAALLGIEKIKTIGDAYMAACGLPRPVADHPVRLAHFALAVHRAVAAMAGRTGEPLAMRVGLASGPVMAGVIGTHRFAYDVWGDTVNLAARLQIQASPGTTLVCPHCRRAIVGSFVVEPNEPIDMRGLGLVETYWLVSDAR